MSKKVSKEYEEAIIGTSPVPVFTEREIDDRRKGIAEELDLENGMELTDYEGFTGDSGYLAVDGKWHPLSAGDIMEMRGIKGGKGFRVVTTADGLKVTIKSIARSALNWVAGKKYENHFIDNDGDESYDTVVSDTEKPDCLPAGEALEGVASDPVSYEVQLVQGVFYYTTSKSGHDSISGQDYYEGFPRASKCKVAVVREIA